MCQPRPCKSPVMPILSKHFATICPSTGAGAEPVVHCASESSGLPCLPGSIERPSPEPGRCRQQLVHGVDKVVVRTPSKPIADSRNACYAMAGTDSSLALCTTCSPTTMVSCCELFPMPWSFSARVVRRNPEATSKKAEPDRNTVNRCKRIPLLLLTAPSRSYLQRDRTVFFLRPFDHFGEKFPFWSFFNFVTENMWQL